MSYKNVLRTGDQGRSFERGHNNNNDNRKAEKESGGRVTEVKIMS